MSLPLRNKAEALLAAVVVAAPGVAAPVVAAPVVATMATMVGFSVSGGKKYNINIDE